MRILLPAVAFSLGLASIPALGQWEPLAVPGSIRYDDLFFINAQRGWAAGGALGWILRTSDGGDTWQVVLTDPAPDHYLRSIEFATPQLGLCGSLTGSFWRTTDGGDTWEDIQDRLPQPVPGICGLSAPTPQVIYGTGVFHGPAYVLKSDDAGESWQHIDMAAQAWCLVDVLFQSADTGLVAGGAAQETGGASIFRTVDGGATWTEVFNTGSGTEWIWKLQSPDDQHIYASIESASFSAPARYARSADGGITWQLDTIAPSGRMQGIGFLDPMHGWAGDALLFETTDGGGHWAEVDPVPGFDRFHRVDGSLAFMGANGVFRHGSGAVSVGEHSSPPEEQVAAYPDPTAGPTVVRAELNARSWARIEVRDLLGGLVARVNNGYLDAGRHEFPVDLSSAAAGAYLVSLYTYRGLVTARLLKH